MAEQANLQIIGRLASSPLCEKIWQTWLPNNHFHLNGRQSNINLMAFMLNNCKEEVLIRLGSELQVSLDELKEWIRENTRKSR